MPRDVLPEWGLTRQERREMRLNKGRKMRVSGRSVFLLQELGARPIDKREKMRRRRQKESE